MTSYGTVVTISRSAVVIYFTFVGDVEERKERITGGQSRDNSFRIEFYVGMTEFYLGMTLLYDLSSDPM